MMKHKSIATVLAAGALGLGFGFGIAPASATAPTARPAPTVRDLGVEKARCAAAIDVRLPELAKLNASLTSAKRITDEHRAAQKSSVSAASSGLSALKTKIAADTDPATLGEDCKSIIEGYRVFALRASQTHVMIAADTEAAAVAALNTAVPKLADAISKAEAAGKNVATAKTALVDLQAKLAEAGTQAGGVAAGVIGLVPADYNTNHNVLDGARSAVKTASADLKAARADIKTITSTVKA
jgi:hypothetical protein